MKGYKTIGYVAATILAVLTVPEIQAIIAEHPAIATIINGVVIGLLRFVTTTPIFKDEK
jgi:hypothetical protein